jgi:hypothetical protein
MSKFLRLTNFIVNTNSIHTIDIKPNKYIIHIITKGISGFNWSFAGFGSGTISSYTSEIEVCKDNHLIDYKIVSDWIDKNY